MSLTLFTKFYYFNVIGICTLFCKECLCVYKRELPYNVIIV